MSEDHCAVCGISSPQVALLPGVGPICPACLFAGNFFGTAAGLRLAQIAQQLPQLSPLARAKIEPLLVKSKKLHSDVAVTETRALFVAAAQECLVASQPVLATCILQLALAIPGDSTLVYLVLGDAAVALDCVMEASQHYKTAGWLAIKSENQIYVERATRGLDAIAPEDPWVEKLQLWLKQR